MNNTRQKIKVVIGTNDLVVGGAQRLVIDQLELLNRDLFDLTLITLIQFPGRGDFYDLVPPDVKVVKLHFRKFTDLREWAKLIRTLREIKPDIVRASLFFSNTVFTLLKPFLGYRVITAEHNSGNPKSLPMRLVDRLLAPLTYTIAADSKMVAKFIAESEHINPKRFTVVYNGVDVVGIERAQKEYAGKRDDIVKSSYFSALPVSRRKKITRSW